MALESFSRFHRGRPEPPGEAELLRRKIAELESQARAVRESLAEAEAEPAVYLYRLEKARGLERGAAKLRTRLGETL